MKRLLALFVLALAFALPAQSCEARTTTSLQLRERSSADSGPVTTISAGQTVTVGTCPGDWCETTSRQEDGYGARRHLGDDGYTNVDGDRVRSPVQASGAPAGASAHCRDDTYSFSAHRRGTCSHHGGVAEWL
ncbi:MAG: DUF3761 domain-containing protein [Gemmatimonadetes bacterium]|nr:DUF3761 domain-containing protein [Gemmatimonadota bacterium]